MSADFSGQRPGEEVEFVFRRHFLESIRGIIAWILFTLLGGLTFLVLDDNIAFWIWLGCFLVGFIIFLNSYILWYFSVYVVTNQRIRQITQHGLFKRTVVDLGLDKIESISYQIPGIIGGIFNYGTLLIQTHVGDMAITKVKHPEETYNKIQALLGKEEF